MAWLVHGDRVIASLEIASTHTQRRRGLQGREGIEGALLLPRTRWVHTFGMRFAIDVAHCDSEMKVLRLTKMQPNRLGRPVWRARCVLEAEAGAFARWEITEGITVEIRR